VPNLVNPVAALYRTVLLDSLTGMSSISNEEIVNLISTTATAASTTAAIGTTTTSAFLAETTPGSNSGDGSLVGLAIGAALGITFGLVTTILTVLLFLRYWRNTRRKDKCVHLTVSNSEPLLNTRPPTQPTPRNDLPVLNTTTENIEMAVLNPTPLPYELVANHYTENLDMKEKTRNFPQLPPIPEYPLPTDVPNIYCRPKFYNPRKGRGISTSTHVYGDLDFTSSESSSYISPDHVSQAWAKANTLREIEEKELELNQEDPNNADNEDIYDAIMVEDDANEDQYLDIISLGITRKVEDEDGDKGEDENDFKEEQGLEDHGDTEDDEAEDIYDNTQTLLKPKNPETGQSKMFQRQSRASDYSIRYVNAEVTDQVEDVQYINTRRAKNGEITPYVPTRKNKKISQNSIRHIPGKPPPPRNKRKAKKNLSTPTRVYTTIDHQALDTASFYSKCSNREYKENAEY